MIVPLKKKISQTRHLVNSESYLIHRVKYWLKYGQNYPSTFTWVSKNGNKIIPGTLPQITPIHTFAFTSITPPFPQYSNKTQVIAFWKRKAASNWCWLHQPPAVQSPFGGEFIEDVLKVITIFSSCCLIRIHIFLGLWETKSSLIA